jgi:hypothetical protein
MVVIGWLFTAVVVLVVLGGIVVAVTALPDVNRYRRLRKM